MLPTILHIETPLPWPQRPVRQQALARLKHSPLTTGTSISFKPLETTGWIVFASAFDKRQPCRFELHTPDGGWRHLLDTGYCSIGQRFHIAVPEGIGEIHVKALDDDSVFWYLTDSERLPNSVPAIWPTLDEVDRINRFFERLEKDCLAEFGWMGGCVLEAFDSLAIKEKDQRWSTARDQWLGNFLRGEHLHYQNREGEETIDAFVDSETLLPVACIARLQASHPIVNRAVDFLVDRALSETTCEGCYTLAYPLMQIAVLRDRDDLADLAWRELCHRRKYLFHDGAIYLRHHGTYRTYRNWARGVAWYLLGHIECLTLSGCDGKWGELAEHITGRMMWVLDQQREDGLWSNFFYEPELVADTAGSAGIATSLLKAHSLGLLDERAVDAAKTCWCTLTRHLYVDGWLGWSSPSNKRGEGPQHQPQLASETFGMGLMGRFAGEIHRLGIWAEFNANENRAI